MTQSELPCDGDGVCMVCKIKPSQDETLNCNTCATPWHVSCLSSPPQSMSLALNWECPDCSTITTTTTSVTTTNVADQSLLSAIRAIESDSSLSDKEKAKRRQQLMCNNPDSSSSSASTSVAAKNELLDLIGGTLNCSICMQLPDRPVTTPCGHNFCLKCFQKWIGQGKRSCANCRNDIPNKIATNPRINSALVVAIRMAKTAKSPAELGQPKAYHFIHNQNRPDKAFTTERAKKSGKANACSGKIFVTVPSDHFGPILAENDPERNQGVLVGECWEDRMECRQWGAHFPHVAGIAGQSKYGAQSVVLSGGYEDDEDHGEWFLYTGSGGRDLSGNKRTNNTHSFDQTFEKMNAALKLSCLKGYPVRVVRSHKEKRSAYAPEKGLRYDGVYRIEKCWRKEGKQGYKVCRYLFVRCDNEPAPWTSNEHGDRPRPLPSIKELNKAVDLTERNSPPHWDYDEEKENWMWKKPPPASLKPVNSDYVEDGSAKKKRQRAQKISARERLLKEFSCNICRKVMTLPITTPCAHNFCKTCLDDAFAGQSLVRNRSCEGRRTLRAQKNIMKCPACSIDIAEFLQNPQVNRELMDVIESLKQKDAEELEENASENEVQEEPNTTDAGEECEDQEEDKKDEDNDEGDSDSQETVKEEKTIVKSPESEMEVKASDENTEKSEKANINEEAKSKQIVKEEKTIVKSPKSETEAKVSDEDIEDTENSEKANIEQAQADANSKQNQNQKRRKAENGDSLSSAPGSPLRRSKRAKAM